MQEFVYYAPTEIIFGKNAESQTGKEIRKWGGNRVLIVYVLRFWKRRITVDGVIVKIDSNRNERKETNRFPSVFVLVKNG